MQPYERIINAVKHRRSDRLPINYNATPEAHAAIKKYLSVQQDEELLKKLGVDIRSVAGRYNGPKELIPGAAINSAPGKDIFGVVWEPKKNQSGTYNEISYHPLANAKTVRDIKNYNWPSLDWFDFSHLKEQIFRINREEKYAIMFFAGGSFESPWYMRGLERFLLDLVECPEIAEEISAHVTDFYLKRALRAIEASDGQITIIGSGGDIGTQRGMMLSPDLWRKHIKPYSTKLIGTFKDMGLITFYHSCGSIVPVIADLIEMGLDILDPVQPKAVGMEPEKLKKNFGRKLVFHGGIDVQELLPFGTPEDVEKEVTRLIHVLGNDGGYIVAPAHAIQADTPPENIWKIYETAQNSGDQNNGGSNES